MPIDISFIMHFPSGSKSLLPSEPRIENPTQAYSLTEQYLLPNLVELESFFLAMREGVDPPLRTALPTKNGKPYPLGQCLEITMAVQKQLDTLDPNTLPPTAQQGYLALKQFLAAKPPCHDSGRTIIHPTQGP